MCNCNAKCIESILVYGNQIFLQQQCHPSSNCGDFNPANIAPFGSCCDSGRDNSFRINSLGACIPCESKGENEKLQLMQICFYVCVLHNTIYMLRSCLIAYCMHNYVCTILQIVSQVLSYTRLPHR